MPGNYPIVLSSLFLSFFFIQAVIGQPATDLDRAELIRSSNSRSPNGRSTTSNTTQNSNPSGQKVMVPADCGDLAQKKTPSTLPVNPGTTKKLIHLNVQLESRVHWEGRTSRFADKSFPFYEQNELSAKEFSKFVNEPSVMTNMQKWRQWYGTIFDNVKSKVDSKIPADFRIKLIVTITPAKQVIVVTEWMDSNSASGEKFGNSIIQAFKSLPQECLKYPDKTYTNPIELWFFADDANGFQLSNPNHPIAVSVK